MIIDIHYYIQLLHSFLLVFIKQFGFRMFKIKISEYFYQLLPNYLHPIICCSVYFCFNRTIFIIH